MESSTTRRKEPRLARHARALLAHATPSKMANLVRVEAEYRRKSEVLRGMPYLFFVDVCNYCNLSCPLCPSALDLFGRERGMITLAEYDGILDQIAPFAFEVNLHNWGEPFLNPDIFAIIERTQARNVMTNVSSNLNTLDEGQIDDIVRSGLEYLVVSLDGITSDVYERYRVGGVLPQVMDNLRALVAAKKRLRSSTPIIEWQFLVMAHNEHQMTEAEALGDEIGVDVMRFAPAGLPFDRLTDTSMAEGWMPAGDAYHEFDPATLHEERPSFDDRHCHYLYRSMTIGPRGAVSPCCVVHAERDDFGVLAGDDLATVWNNGRYRSARAMFAGSGSGEGTPCARCDVFRRPAMHASQGVEG